MIFARGGRNLAREKRPGDTGREKQMVRERNYETDMLRDTGRAEDDRARLTASASRRGM